MKKKLLLGFVLTIALQPILNAHDTVTWFKSPYSMISQVWQRIVEQTRKHPYLVTGKYLK